jgi:hypothetical protein
MGETAFDMVKSVIWKYPMCFTMTVPTNLNIRCQLRVLKGKRRCWTVWDHPKVILCFHSRHMMQAKLVFFFHVNCPPEQRLFCISGALGDPLGINLGPCLVCVCARKCARL